MKSLKNSMLLFLIICISHGSSLYAKDVTLQECIKYAMENHPDLMVSRKDMQLALNSYKVVKSQRSLQVSATMSTVETEKTSSQGKSFKVTGRDTDIGLFAGISAIYNLYNPSQKDTEHHARLDIDLTKIKEQEKKNNLILGIKNAYYAYLIAKDYYKLYKQNLDSADFALKTTEKFFKEGTHSFFDLSQAKIRYESVFLDFLKTKNKLYEKKVELYSAMGIDDFSIGIDPIEVSNLPQLKYSVNELNKLANIYNTNIQQLDISIKKSKVAIALAKDGHYPKASLGLSFGIRHRNLFNQPGTSGGTFDDKFSKYDSENNKVIDPLVGFTINFQWPIYTGGSITTKVESAVITYNKVLYSKRSVFLNIKNQITSQVRSLEEILKQLKLQKLNIENANKHYILAQKSYKSGSGTQENLINAELSLLQSHSSYTQTKYAYLMRLAVLSNIIGLHEDYICKK